MYEINRDQHREHGGVSLPPIQQTIYPDHILKHRALKLRTLKWDDISRICFSGDYAQVVVAEIINQECTQPPTSPDLVLEM